MNRYKLVVEIDVVEDPKLFDDIAAVLREARVPGIQHDYIMASVFNSAIVAAVASGQFKKLDRKKA